MEVNQRVALTQVLAQVHSKSTLLDIYWGSRRLLPGIASTAKALDYRGEPKTRHPQEDISRQSSALWREKPVGSPLCHTILFQFLCGLDFGSWAFPLTTGFDVNILISKRCEFAEFGATSHRKGFLFVSVSEMEPKWNPDLARDGPALYLSHIPSPEKL